MAETYSQGISGQIIPITADITKKKDIAALYDQISSKEKRLDILINSQYSNDFTDRVANARPFQMLASAPRHSRPRPSQQRR